MYALLSLVVGAFENTAESIVNVFPFSVPTMYAILLAVRLIPDLLLRSVQLGNAEYVDVAVLPLSIAPLAQSTGCVMSNVTPAATIL